MVQFVDDEIHSYDGKHHGVLTLEKYKEYKYNTMSSKYVVVGKNYNQKAKKMTIEEAFVAYTDMADRIKEKTFGKEFL